MHGPEGLMSPTDQYSPILSMTSPTLRSPGERGFEEADSVNYSPIRSLPTSILPEVPESLLSPLPSVLPSAAGGKYLNPVELRKQRSLLRRNMLKDTQIAVLKESLKLQLLPENLQDMVIDSAFDISSVNLECAYVYGWNFDILDQELLDQVLREVTNELGVPLEHYNLEIIRKVEYSSDIGNINTLVLFVKWGINYTPDSSECSPPASPVTSTYSTYSI